MVWAAKRSLRHQASIVLYPTRHGVDFGGFQCFPHGHGRQNTGQSFGQHGFSRSGWTNQNNVVPSSRRNFHTAFNGFLAFHIREIKFGKIQVFVKFVLHIDDGAFQRFVFIKKSDYFLDVFHSIDFQIRYDCGFLGVLDGQNKTFITFFLSFYSNGECAFNRLKIPVQ